MWHCRLLTAREVTIDRRWQVSLYDPFWRLYRNRDDGAVLIGDDGEVPMRAGTCMVLPAWSRYRTRCSGQVRHNYLHFDPIGLPSDWVRSTCLRLLALGQDRIWDDLLGHLPLDDTSSWSVQFAMQAQLCHAVAAYVRQVIGSSAPSGEAVAARSLDRVAVAPAVRLIENHLAGPLPVDLLARTCGLARDPFTRRFTSAMGSPPARHVVERRVAAAAHQLIASDAPIEDIAAGLGFANRHHFSRVFQRVLRTSPAAYRRKGRLGS